MVGFVVNLEEKAISNENFRQVLFTGPHSQLVVMSLLPGEDIGEEVHQVDQFIRVEEGEGKSILNGEETVISAGFSVSIPAGTTHNIINTSADKKMKLYTVYSPAQHKDGTIHATKVEAVADEADELH